MAYTEEILTTKDGIRIRAYICKLPEAVASNRPTILFFHVSLYLYIDLKKLFFVK
jgi:hypothetical protein